MGKVMFNMAKVLNLRLFKETFKKKLESCSDDKRKMIIVIGVMIGILMMMLSGLMNGNERKTKRNQDVFEKDFCVKLYEQELENRLLDIVEKIEGVGKAQIMVTLENSVEYIFAQERREKTDKISDYQDKLPLKTQERNDQERKLMLVDGPNGRRQALVKTQVQPKVKGVVVVCQGGNNFFVNQRVTSLITTALNISSNRVYVTKSLN